MATPDDILSKVNKRLKDRGDTFLDSDGEALFTHLKSCDWDAHGDQKAVAEAVREIEHRRSQKVE